MQKLQLFMQLLYSGRETGLITPNIGPSEIGARLFGADGFRLWRERLSGNAGDESKEENKSE
ncbi:MAG: hypothetical protein COW00_17750 [Bdellovibrio sp. CG12_big_fil_rev_8_21_14_0_65_39_13]|nr:MAG: hypothetical protein COW00_17750 [Bdellovibrio sp. CG12_big_fil_rev_8_21_14_0_65_39_13]